MGIKNGATHGLLGHFGYFGIIIALIGGIIGLPIPDEVLLTYVGYNVFQGKLSYIISMLSAFVGATGGISLSYYIGYKFGVPLLKKYGPKFHITEHKINLPKEFIQKNRTFSFYRLRLCIRQTNCLNLFLPRHS